MSIRIPIVAPKTLPGSGSSSVRFPAPKDNSRVRNDVFGKEPLADAQPLEVEPEIPDDAA